MVGSTKKRITYSVGEEAQCIKNIGVAKVSEEMGFCTRLTDCTMNPIYHALDIDDITILADSKRHEELSFDPKNCYAYFFIIQNSCERSILLSCDESTGHKIWVDGCWLAICDASKPVQFAVHAGESLIILTGGNGKLPGLRINDLDREKHAPASVVFGTYHKHGRHIFIHENRYSPDQRYLYEFYITPGIKDILDITLPVRVEVRLRDTEESIKTFEVPFYQKAQLDLTKLDYDATQFNWLTVSFLYMRKDGYDWMETRAFYFYSMRHYLQYCLYSKHGAILIGFR